MIDEVNPISVWTRKDFAELMNKSRDDTVHIYVCPNREGRRHESVPRRQGHPGIRLPANKCMGKGAS
jgi:hypothetical protein